MVNRKLKKESVLQPNQQPHRKNIYRINAIHQIKLHKKYHGSIANTTKENDVSI